MTRGLTAVSSSSLRRLLAALESGRMRAPVTRGRLIAIGLREQLDAIVTTLAGFSVEACTTVLSSVLAERAKLERPSPELVWTGPEGTGATARDTAVVLRDLFESAREHVVLAGYSFKNAPSVLGPLHRTMTKHNIAVHFFVKVEQLETAVDDPDAALIEQLQEFVDRNWPFGKPYPEVYCDRRAGDPGPPWCSLHAKCVAVDGRRAFISSANFTTRGQERNIETGVLIDDPVFTEKLERQWLGLVRSGLVVRWRRS